MSKFDDVLEQSGLKIFFSSVEPSPSSGTAYKEIGLYDKVPYVTFDNACGDACCNNGGCSCNASCCHETDEDKPPLPKITNKLN